MTTQKTSTVTQLFSPAGTLFGIQTHSESQYVYPLSGRRPKLWPRISITSLVETKNSSDLDSGRRPGLKSEDFSFLPKGLAR